MAGLGSGSGWNVFYQFPELTQTNFGIFRLRDREKNFDLCPRWRAPGLGGISRPKIHSVFAIGPGQPSDRGREEFPLKGLLSLSRVSGLQILRRACHVSNNACVTLRPAQSRDHVDLV